MRISTNQMQTYAMNSMLEQQTKLSKTQLEVATGKKFLSPSDNPPAAVEALGLTQRVASLQQYQSNVDQAKSSLNLEDAALSSVVSQLQRVRELAVQSQSTTIGAAGRLALSYEVNQLLQSTLSLANTQDANGHYIFSGFQSQTPAYTNAGGGVFTFNGDQGQRQLEVAPGVLVAATDSGEQVFGSMPAAGGGTTDVFTVINNLATDMQSNVFNANSLTNLDTALNTIANRQASIGARQNTVDAVREVNASYIIDSQSDLSTVQDLDYAEGATRLNIQLAGFQAAQQAFLRIQNLSLFSLMR